MRTALAAALAVAFASAIAGCTTTQTSVTAPTSDKCQISVSNAPSSFAAGGGAGTVTIDAARDCAWSVAANASWVTITGDKSGQGAASIAYTVAANGVPSARSTAIVVGSQSVSLNQAAAPCQFSLSRAADNVAANGGRLSVGVSTLTGCAWSAASGASWIAIAAGQTGNASATVTVSVSANGGPARVGQVNIAGQTYTVNQEGAPSMAPTPPAPLPPAPSPAPGPAPSPAPAPGPPPPPSAGQRVSFDGLVTSASGRCPELTLTVAARTVITDKSTKFKDISCGDVAKGGRRVDVSGVVDPTGAVRADAISKAGNDDD